MTSFKLPLTMKVEESTPIVPEIIPEVVSPVIPEIVPEVPPVIVSPIVEPKEEPTEMFKTIFEKSEPDAPIIEEDPVNAIVSALELALPEGVTKWDAPTLSEKVKEKMDANRQVLNLDEFDPEIKVLFDFVQNNGGTLMGLPMDPKIQQLNEITLYDAEYFFRLDTGRLFEQQGFDEEEINELVEKRISKIPEETRTEYFENYQQEKIRTEINPLIVKRVDELNKEKQLYRDRIEKSLAGNSERVVESMIKTAEQLENFVGLPFSQKHKEAIVAKVKSGDITKEIAKDPGGYQMLGYLLKTMGAEAIKVYADLTKNGTTSGYYQGIKSTLEQVYGVPPIVPGLKTESPGGGNETPVLSWSSLRTILPPK